MLTSRTLFTWKQKAELWERWKNGQSVLAISRGLERRNKTGVQRIVALHGGVAPAPRRRAVAALKLEEREEISRGNCGRSVDTSDRAGSRTIAIDDKPGDSTQRWFAGLPCKPGRQARVGAGATPQALSPGTP
jgi:hypothetical protein